MAKLLQLTIIAVLLVPAVFTQQRRSQFGRRAPIQDTLTGNTAPLLLDTTTYRPKIFETHREIAPNLGDGNFKYYSATSDGLESEQTGHFSNPLYSQVHQGSYTTKDEHGQVVKVDYVADKDGFRPIGPAGVPLMPTPPPVPLEHLQARRDILALQAKIREQHLGYLRAGYAAHEKLASVAV